MTKPNQNLGALPSGQIDQIDRDKMTRSYNKDTETTLTEIIPPPTSSIFEKPEREEEEEKNSSRKMVEIWNGHIQAKTHPEHPVRLTKERTKKLQEVLRVVFGSQLNGWEDYCSHIASCQFLMGRNESGFKAGIDWALKEENIYKVLEKAFYDKPAEEQNQILSRPGDAPTQETFLQAVEEHLSHSALSGDCKDTWILICQDLAKKFPLQTYLTWFTHITPVDLSNTEAILQVESPFVRDYLMAHYETEVRKSISLVCPNVSKVIFRDRKSKQVDQKNGQNE